jgi:DNA-binding NarL/FixJ family response regulator
MPEATRNPGTDLSPSPPRGERDTLRLRLSPRQTACLRLAAHGLTSHQIAARLEISSRTVDQYIGEACERLGVRSRIHAVARALSSGLVSLDPP